MNRDLIKINWKFDRKAARRKFSYKRESSTRSENYCVGLLLPGARKSVEPMTARLAPDDVRRTYQSLSLGGGRSME